MLNLELIPVVSTTLYILALSFPPGFLLLRRHLAAHADIAFLMALPLYLALGFVAQFLVSFIVGMFFVNQFVPITVSAVSTLALFAENMQIRNYFPRFKNRPTVLSLITIALLFISGFYIVDGISINKWPPFGDVIIHGMLTSLTLKNGSVPLELTPLMDRINGYPMGFHVLSANLSQLFGFYPAETIFLLGGIGTMFFGPLLFLLVFFLTRSSILGTIAFFVPYVNSGSLMHWFGGNFSNGPYPAVIGYLMLFLLLNLLTLTYVKKLAPLQFSTCFIVIFSGLLFIYPSFFIHAIIVFTVFLVTLLYQRKEFNIRFLTKCLTKKVLTLNFSWINLALLVIFFYTLLIGNAIELMANVVTVNMSYIPGHRDFNVTLILANFFARNNFLSYGIIVSLFLASYYFLKSSRGKDLSIPPIIPVFVALLVSILDERLYFLMPDRTIVLLSLLAWVIISIFVRNLNKDLVLLRASKRTLKSRSFLIDNGPIIALFALFLISPLTPLIQSNVLINHEYPGWFPSKFSNFDSDFGALEWINKNVNADDLILNDNSYISCYIQSLSLKNLAFSCGYRGDFAKIYEPQSVWNPQYLSNQDEFMEMLLTQRVKYMFVSEEWGFYGGKSESDYREKLIPSAKSIEILDKYPFLEKVYEKGKSAIYEVVTSYSE